MQEIRRLYAMQEIIWNTIETFYGSTERQAVHLKTHISIQFSALKKNRKLILTEIEWRRIDEVYKSPLFDPKLINIDYIKQGSLGDCYFISALLRIARQL